MDIHPYHKHISTMNQEQASKKQHSSDMGQHDKKVIRCAGKTVVLPSTHSNNEVPLPKELLPSKFLVDLETSTQK